MGELIIKIEDLKYAYQDRARQHSICGDREMASWWEGRIEGLQDVLEMLR